MSDTDCTPDYERLAEMLAELIERPLTRFRATSKEQETRLAVELMNASRQLADIITQQSAEIKRMTTEVKTTQRGKMAMGTESKIEEQLQFINYLVRELNESATRYNVLVDEFEELEARIDALRWIPVGERLPEMGIPVDLAVVMPTLTIRYPDMCRTTHPTDKKKWVWVFPDGEIVHPQEATHWREIDLPKNNGEGVPVPDVVSSKLPKLEGAPTVPGWYWHTGLRSMVPVADVYDDGNLYLTHIHAGVQRVDNLRDPWIGNWYGPVDLPTAENKEN